MHTQYLDYTDAFTHAQAAVPERGLLYNAAAAQRSWLATRNFLEEVFA